MSDFKINSIATKQGQHGPVIAGVSTINSTGCMKIPSGPTGHRGGRGRLVFGGGYYPSPHADLGTMDFVEISTLGNAVDFGDLSIARAALQCGSSGTRGLFAGGTHPGRPSTGQTQIDYITFQSGGGVGDFGDMSFIGTHKGAGISNGVRGVFCGGYDGNSPYHTLPTCQFVTIATTGNSDFFGELTQPAQTDASVSDRTRGCITGMEIGNNPSTTLINNIEFLTTATLGNAQDFGDLTLARRCSNGCSSSTTRGLFYSGSPGPGPHRNTIDFITIQSKGDATDFGDMSTFGNVGGAVHGSNLTRSVNHQSGDGNVIEFVTIATTGNTSDFGDMTNGRAPAGAIDNSNGSIT
jgi:hypothetical protein